MGKFQGGFIVLDLSLCPETGQSNEYTKNLLKLLKESNKPVFILNTKNKLSYDFSTYCTKSYTKDGVFVRLTSQIFNDQNSLSFFRISINNNGEIFYYTQVISQQMPSKTSSMVADNAMMVDPSKEPQIADTPIQGEELNKEVSK